MIKKLFGLLMIIAAIITTGMIGFLMAGELPFPQTWQTLATIAVFCISWANIMGQMFQKKAEHFGLML